MGTAHPFRIAAMNRRRTASHRGASAFRWPVFVCLAVGFLLPGWSLSPPSAAAQEAPKSPSRIQVISGNIAAGEVVYYSLPNLKKGTTLYVYAHGTSGNLDPFLSLVPPGTDIPKVRKLFWDKVAAALKEGQDPLVVLPELAKRFLLAFDDDGGQGYAAAFKTMIQADGTYTLGVASTPAAKTFGGYRLILGLDAPEVLAGDGKGTSASIAILDTEALKPVRAVQQIEGTIAAEKPVTFFDLNPVHAGETLQVYLEATSGDLRPLLKLEDYGGKPLRFGNFGGKLKHAALKYTFPVDGSDYRLVVSGTAPDGTTTRGDFRLLLGINAPEVEKGEGKPDGRSIVRPPLRVEVALQLEQVTSVDQQAENFGAVGSFWLRWQDAKLAFRPDALRTRIRLFPGEEFFKFAEKEGIVWPAASFTNQQGKRWSQNQLVAVKPSGEAIYYERFSGTFQAPNFDFRRFPFDQQMFFFHIDALFSEDYFTFVPWEGMSEVGKKLGEEEWIIGPHETSVRSVPGELQQTRSRFVFDFPAHRHVTYYLVRIFLPMGIILAISWLSMMLRDYKKRVDVAAGNLLLFIAFNFTIGSSLPRLGYLTFMDSVLITTFAVGGINLVYNLLLTRMFERNPENRLFAFDRYMLGIQPLLYLLVFGGLWFAFF